MNIVDIFRGKVIDVSAHSYIVEITGNREKIDAILELLKPLGIVEIVRTGRVAMFRGPRTLAGGGMDEKENVA